jgi:hypothetical protein
VFGLVPVTQWIAVSFKKCVGMVCCVVCCAVCSVWSQSVYIIFVYTICTSGREVQDIIESDAQCRMHEEIHVSHIVHRGAACRKGNQSAWVVQVATHIGSLFPLALKLNLLEMVHVSHMVHRGGCMPQGQPVSMDGSQGGHTQWVPPLP